MRTTQTDWDKRNPEKTALYKRRYDLKRRYGITIDEYEQALADQGGRCYICRRPPIIRRLVVDHNHATGTVRKLLCGPCNAFVGLLESVDNAEEVIRNLSNYKLS
jgi:hypothetical protein